VSGGSSAKRVPRGIASKRKSAATIQKSPVKVKAATTNSPRDLATTSAPHSATLTSGKRRCMSPSSPEKPRTSATSANAGKDA
jgi:hypothetical protein